MAASATIYLQKVSSRVNNSAMSSSGSSTTTSSSSGKDDNNTRRELSTEIDPETIFTLHEQLGVGFDSLSVSLFSFLSFPICFLHLSFLSYSHTFFLRAYGPVHRATHNATGADVAIKILSVAGSIICPDERDSDPIENITREIELMSEASKVNSLVNEVKNGMKRNF